jgi:hypothetical protein
MICNKLRGMYMKISETKLRHVIREEIAQTNESNEARLVRSFYDFKR